MSKPELRLKASKIKLAQAIREYRLASQMVNGTRRTTRALKQLELKDARRKTS